MVKGVAVISGTNNIKGSLHFNQLSNGITHVKGRITGLTPGLHGFHIHALGDTTNGCNSTGPHYNPMKKDHGAPSDTERHAGDLGNILADSDGVAEVSISDSQIPLSGQHSIIGRAVVVHADPDDLGRGGHELSKTTGNAGARVGCGIIGLQSSVQIRSMLIWSHKCSTVWCIVYGFLFIITTKGYKTLSTYEWYDCMNKTSRILLQLIHRRIFYPEVPHASNFAHRNK